MQLNGKSDQKGKWKSMDAKKHITWMKDAQKRIKRYAGKKKTSWTRQEQQEQVQKFLFFFERQDDEPNK